MDKKKITRRAAIGTAIGAVAVSPVVIKVLLDSYEVELPEGTRPITVGGKLAAEYDGAEIELEVPVMVVETPEDEEKFHASIKEAIEKHPQYAVKKRKALRDAKAQARQDILDKYAETEKKIRQGIADATDMTESEKAALLEKSLEDLQSGRDALLKQAEELAL